MQVLRNLGILFFDEDKQTYSPGLRLVRLAHASWAQSSLAPVAAPHLDWLSGELDMTLHLAQLDGGQVLYIDKRNSARPAEMFSQAGKVVPAYCTGIDKAMLAHLKEPSLGQAIDRQSFYKFTSRTVGSAGSLRDELSAIRARGYALDNEEHEQGKICVAVPILARTGRVLGGLSATSTSTELKIEELGEIAPRLARVAALIALDAENWRFPERPG